MTERLTDEERAGDAMWSEYEALLDCDQDGCEHTEPGDPLHCWHCRRSTFRLVARKHLGQVSVELRALRDEVERLKGWDGGVYEGTKQDWVARAFAAEREVERLKAERGELLLKRAMWESAEEEVESLEEQNRAPREALREGIKRAVAAERTRGRALSVEEVAIILYAALGESGEEGE